MAHGHNHQQSQGHNHTPKQAIAIVLMEVAAARSGAASQAPRDQIAIEPGREQQAAN
jgi:hypothetical protein